MFDYIIALAVGVVGVFVVYTLFLSISVSEAPVTRATVKKSSTKAAKKTKAQPAESKKSKKEEDAIIAAELAIANGGMQADKKVFHATTLDEEKERKKKVASKSAAAKGEAKQEAQGPSAKQVAADKVAGFEVVKTKAETAATARPAVKSASPDGQPRLTQKEALDKKLGSFFRNSAKKGKKRYDDDDSKPEGPKITVKRDKVSNSKSWNKEE